MVKWSERQGQRRRGGKAQINPETGSAVWYNGQDASESHRSRFSGRSLPSPSLEEEKSALTTCYDWGFTAVLYCTLLPGKVRSREAESARNDKSKRQVTRDNAKVRETHRDSHQKVNRNGCRAAIYRRKTTQNRESARERKGQRHKEVTSCASESNNKSFIDREIP